ncbi:chorismate synthase [Lactobacillus sp. CC-MHH1034]|uniref:chorismate synthase n=1 Tax=Agrilactobacillus fermenti TaxID=2586909 RepID=UPI001E5061BC|nr:chorismate synthase [Agrilactobacillus fermenti]MCD2255904.1 chorismate synthase [Agrilactobacillus fermenti]
MRYFTAGESHGPQLTAIIEGLPANLKLDIAQINADMKRRKQGYGRGARQKIETDEVQITAGLRHQLTLGSPLVIQLPNKDFAHWQSVMSPTDPATPENSVRQVTKPRPGHADLVGGMKYQHQDLRNVLERSSARETAMRVAVGSVAKQLLQVLGIDVLGFVRQIGPAAADQTKLATFKTLADLRAKTEASVVRTFDTQVETAMKAAIDQAKKAGDTLGGIIQVIATGVPAGLGSYVSADRKLDGQLAQAIVGINAFKGVAFGDGFDLADHPGSEDMDEIFYDAQQGFYRQSDHLGGFEGGMTNGMPIELTAVMKPIPTLYKPLRSVDIHSKKAYQANVERSDTTAVPAAAVVAEAMTAITLAQAILEMFDANAMARLKAQFEAYKNELKNY